MAYNPVTSNGDVIIDCDNDDSGDDAAIKFTHDNGAELMRISEYGYVGIGSAQPGRPLVVSGNMKASQDLYLGKAYSSGTITDGSGSGRIMLIKNGRVGINDATPTEMLSAVSGSVGVGTTSPAGCAVLEMKSTSRGFLPPRMSTTERGYISSPPDGLVIYNTTDHKLQYYDGSASQWYDV